MPVRNVGIRHNCTYSTNPYVTVPYSGLLLELCFVVNEQSLCLTFGVLYCVFDMLRVVDREVLFLSFVSNE